MKLIAIAAALCMSTAAGAITVQTTDFITSPTAQNGFEGIAVDIGFDGTAGHTEDGITVSYIGSPGSIWTVSQAPAEGVRSWYPDGGSNGYTRITFGGPVTAVEFRAGSGWFGGAPNLYFDVLLGGVSQSSGIAGAVPNYPSGFVFYGFSGGSFDEVRLQVRTDGGPGFDPGIYEAGAFDDVQIGDVVDPVTEPAALALMLAGLGLVGAARRRSARAA